MRAWSGCSAPARALEAPLVSRRLTPIVKPLKLLPKSLLAVVLITAASVSGAPAKIAAPRQFNFENDISPLLTRHGCNASQCHGKAEGQNGFKLSVFGYDALADWRAFTAESALLQPPPSKASSSPRPAA